MMKKIFATVLIVLGLIAASSCGNHGAKAVESDVDSTMVAADSLMAADSVAAADTVSME